MNKIEKSELKLIIEHITKPNYDSIDMGLDLLVKSDNIEFYEKILLNCRIVDGCLIASRSFTVTAPRQPFLDYALWNIIGQKPNKAKVHSSMSNRNIKKIKLQEYESYLHWYNRVEKFPVGITYLNNIETLDFSAARMKSIPKEISHFKKLKSIDLCNNKIEEFPIGLCEIESLKFIDLNRNNIKELPRELIKLKNLEYLYLDSNEISQLPEGIKALQELRNLSISNNNITEIPLEICELVNLEKISLRNNCITFIPEELINLKKITELDLSGNELNAIPNLHSNTIKSLNLSRNKIIILNDCIKNMIGLESLYLNENRGLNLVESGIASLGYLKNIEMGKTGNLSPKPHVLYLNGRINIEKYFNKILYHYKLRDRFKREIKNTTIENNKHRKFKYYRDDENKPPKEIEGVVSNLSNYFNSKEIDVVDVGIKLMTSIANESVYNYIFGKWKIIKGELSLMYYYNGFEFERYHYRKYILLKLLSSKKKDLKIHRNISIDNIKSLEYNFFENKYPDFIFSLYNLNKVDFRLNNHELTNNIYKLTKLQEIRLREVSNLDLILFDKFPHLKILDIEKVTTKSSLRLENIRNLEKLSIDSVNAQLLTIKNNHNLVEISLYGLEIDNIEIYNCRNLKKIKIINCDFKNEQYFSNFPELIEFTSERNKMAGLMDLISKCSSLEKISIENTDSLVVDKLFSNIKKIKSLSLEANGIDYIPKEIGELEKLEYLNISKNNIKHIPSSLAKCKYLKHLDIRFQCGKTKVENKLNDIPVELFQIKKMKSIKVAWSSLELRKFKSKLSESNLHQKSRIITNEQF